MSPTEPLRPAAGQPAWRRRLRQWLPDVAAFAGALLTACLAALLLGSLPGCGGGGGVGGEGTGSFGATTFSSGTITGFGSIIVNGVRFDERSADRRDDDDQALTSDDLALGMVVQVSGGAITTAADGTRSAVAQTVRTNRALVGPVAAPDAAAGRLTVLGQTVRVSAATVFDERLGGWSGLTAGRLVEVYGFYNPASAAFDATRIAPSGGSTWRVSGPVGTVDGTNRRFTLGSQTYSYAALASAPAEGAVVRLQVRTTGPDASSTWTVDAQRNDDSAPQERDGAELDGLVTSVASASRFVVNGVTVDASGAQVSGSVQVGARVEVSGTLRSGVLVAARVTASGAETNAFELNGSIASLDTAGRSFVLRGVTVSYARSDLRFDQGSAALLAVGRKLKVEGVLSADRTRLEATRIRFDD